MTNCCTSSSEWKAVWNFGERAVNTAKCTRMWPYSWACAASECKTAGPSRCHSFKLHNNLEWLCSHYSACSRFRSFLQTVHFMEFWVWVQFLIVLLQTILVNSAPNPSAHGLSIGPLYLKERAITCLMSNGILKQRMQMTIIWISHHFRDWWHQQSLFLFHRFMNW